MLTQRSKDILASVHPTLRKKIELLDQKCAEKGLHFQISQGLRDEAQQNDLYAQGRSGPRKDWKKVTSLKYPYSLHNWGLAVDFYRDEKGKDYWDNSDGFFEKVGTIAQSIGLSSGCFWRNKDRPHLELPGFTVKGKKGLQALYGKTPEGFLKACKIL